MRIPKMCACGEKMHLSPSQYMLLKMLSKEWGSKKKVKIAGGKMYLVPTYYIVLHGLKAAELPKMNFPVIDKD